MNKSFSIWDYGIHGMYFFIYGFFKYFPSPVGDIFRKLISKPFIKKMGKVRIYEGVTLWYPYRIEIGSHVTINEWCYINEYGTVKIGDNVRIGNRTTILSSDHSWEEKGKAIYKQPIKALPTVIEEDVFIGCSVIIRGGVHIGRHSVIGAGTVVTKDVPENSIIVGCPGRVIGSI